MVDLRLGVALAVAVAALAAGALAAPEPVESCAVGAITIDRAFDGGAFAACRRTGPASFVLTIAPEDSPPINCSPWYAFRLRQKGHPAATTAQVTLDYTACGHRYRPLQSVDGLSWQPVEDARIVDGSNGKQAWMSVPLAQSVTVAAQELIDARRYQAAEARYARLPFVRRAVLGHSIEGRPISALIVHEGSGKAREQILLLGRQHPPEVTGALALESFIAALMEDSPLAHSFRQRFATTIVPLLNPDGVARGHWRHNRGGKDLNRDWDRFTQPETLAIGRWMAAVERDPRRTLRLLIDFHSTRSDLIYTIPDDLPTDPPLFARRWVENLGARVPGYRVNRVSEHQPGLPTAKTTTYQRYGIPTATFEVGDNTHRGRIAQVGREAALAMMAEMLASPPPQPSER